MRSVLDQLDNSEVSAGPSYVVGLDAVPPEFEDEALAPESDPETDARYKRIRAMFKADPPGAAALIEEMQATAKSAFVDLANMDPLDPRLGVTLARFQTLQSVVQKIQSLR